MAINPKCDCKDCNKELGEFGALLFGPLTKNGSARRKFHICITCYARIRSRATVDATWIGFQRSSPFLLSAPDKEGMVIEHGMTHQTFKEISMDLLNVAVVVT